MAATGFFLVALSIKKNLCPYSIKGQSFGAIIKKMHINLLIKSHLYKIDNENWKNRNLNTNTNHAGFSLSRKLSCKYSKKSGYYTCKIAITIVKNCQRKPLNKLKPTEGKVVNKKMLIVCTSNTTVTENLPWINYSCRYGSVQGVLHDSRVKNRY